MMDLALYSTLAGVTAITTGVQTLAAATALSLITGALFRAGDTKYAQIDARLDVKVRLAQAAGMTVLTSAVNGACLWAWWGALPTRDARLVVPVLAVTATWLAAAGAGAWATLHLIHQVADLRRSSKRRGRSETKA